MADIKVYKEILKIELKDWTMLNSEKTIEDLRKYIENAKDVLLIDWVLFNKYEFKKAYSYNWTDIDQFILSHDKDTIQRLRIREKEKKEKVGKWFESVQEIKNFLERKRENIQNFTK